MLAKIVSIYAFQCVKFFHRKIGSCKFFDKFQVWDRAGKRGKKKKFHSINTVDIINIKWEKLGGGERRSRMERMRGRRNRKLAQALQDKAKDKWNEKEVNQVEENEK